MIIIVCDICRATIRTVGREAMEVQPQRLGVEIPIVSYCDPCGLSVEKLEAEMTARGKLSRGKFHEEMEKLRKERRP